MQWTTLDLLLIGGPHEVLPGELAEHERLAKRWVAHPSLTDAERERIQAVWLDGKYRSGLPMTNQRWQELRSIAGEIR